MSEQVLEVQEQETQAVPFKNVKQYLTHLKGEDVAVTKEEVIATLEGILSRPSTSGQRRGQLAGIPLEDMTDDQLKREIINAKSVLYKAAQRGAASETIEKNQARVAAAEAEKARRTPVKEEVAEGSTESTEEVYATEEADLNEEI